MDIAFHFITAALYLVLAVWDYQTQSPEPSSASEAKQGVGILGSKVYRLIPCVWLLHVAGLYPSMVTDAGLNLSLGHALSLIGILVVAVYWIGSRTEPIGVLRSIVLGFAALAVIMPTLFPSSRALAVHHLAFEAHIIVSLIAYSLLVIAALHASLMSLQEQKLHRGELNGVFGRLPPLVVMDTLLFRMVVTGFVLLTLTVLSGVLFSEELFGRPFTFNHKNILGLVSWVIFAGLLVGRWGYGLRGRRAARLTIIGFSVLALAYLGSKFVLEVILHRV